MLSNERDEANHAKPKLELLGLPLIILRMILEQLYRDDRATLLAFRLASRPCLSESDVLLFRSVRICEPGDRGYPQWLLKRLGDPKDTLASHVRHLQIGPFYKEEKFYHGVSTQLGQVISNLRELRSLSWNTDTLSSGRALKAFHRTCPTAQLHVVQKTRRWKPIDRCLLSSPQLHSLDMDFHYLAGPTFSGFNGRNEFPILKQCLLKGNSIKVLHLNGFSFTPQLVSQFEEFSHTVTTWWKGPFNFQWQNGDRFPALQEFWWGMGGRVSGSTYDFSAEESCMWLRCTDWSRLRVLSLGFFVDATPFFTILTGTTPQLSQLTFTNRHRDANVSTVSKFLSAITALESVCFRCLDYQIFLMILSTVVDHHSHSLKEMDIGVGSGMPDWSRLQYEDLFQKAPAVSHLRMVNNYSTPGSEEFEGEWVVSGIDMTPDQKYKMMKAKSRKLMSSVNEKPQFGLSWRG